MMNKEMERDRLSLYVHIPFCIRKCAYCDFLSFPCGRNGRGVEEYLACLLEEIRLQAKNYGDRKVPTVFIGGGTPTVLSGEQIRKLMACIQENFHVPEDAEVTMEANPGTLGASGSGDGKDKLRMMREAGINRLSMGLQSIHEEELRILGRIHDFSAFAKNYQSAREAGFSNINVDLMSGLPGQTFAKWESTLRQVAELQPEHISAYSLIIEEGTPFFERYNGGEDPCLPTEEADREMVHATDRVLRDYGYSQYEISNYAKPGRECRHNLVYWHRGNYLGLGLGASSCVDEVRWKNSSDLSLYEKVYRCGEGMEKVVCEREELAPEDRLFEAIMLGLRLNEGLDESVFLKRYGCDLKERYKEPLGQLAGDGLLLCKNGRVFLTEKGRDLADHCIRKFMDP